MEQQIRQLALKLYSFAEKDRQWVLDGLELKERERINLHLEELERKNIPRDGTLIHELIEQAKKAIDKEWSEELSYEKKVIKAIDEFPAGEIVSCLRNEAPWIVAVLSQVHVWTWWDTLERQLDANVRMQVKKLAREDSSSVRQEVKISILEGLLQLLQGENVDNSGRSDEVAVDNSAALTPYLSGKKRRRRWWAKLWE